VTPQPNDVVFSYETRLGEAAIIPEGLRCCLGRRMALMRPDPLKVDPRFLLYAYLGPDFHETLRERTIHGSTVERILLTEFPDFRISVPDLPTQRAVAALLGALDDKIDLSRRMNRTLHSIARAIFKSWFVNTTPSRGPAGGGESVYRSEEWPEIAFGDTVHILSGGTPRTSEPEYWGGEVPWYSVADAPTDADVFVVHTQKSITDAGLENSAAQLVPALTTIISARGTVGTCAMTARPMAFNQSCFGLRPRDGFGIYYTYFSTLTAVDALRRSAHGSVFSTITRDTFRSIAVHKPPRHRVEAFESAAEPLMNRVLLNVRETRRLVGIRDALLPRLMSGALRHNAPAARPGSADA
jgi:type I restriction enzyme S subunit